MNKQDWYNMGSQIGDLVQKAIDSNDFKQLNESISETVNTTMDMVQERLRQAAQQGTAGTWRSAETAFKQAGRNVRTERMNGTAFEQAKANAFGNKNRTSGRMIHGVRIRRAVKGPVLMGVGFSFTGIFGILFAVFSMLATAYHSFFGPALISLLFTLVFFLMGMLGVRENGKAKHQKQYLNVMGERTSVSIQELASATGRSKDTVKKELKAMISEGMFPDGAYLDTMETTFMTSKEAYQQCEATERQYHIRKAEEEAAKEMRAKDMPGDVQARQAYDNKSRLTAEEQAILREGRAFIAHIRECNEAISDEIISDKLDKLEAVVARIFDQVAASSESAPDLHKMMSYYLPITRKLVDAYRDLDAQKVSGQNIINTKQEISASLDTINSAFENLLDSFFQDTAWDIASDISVLNTMMAQDGLMKKDFQKKESGREENKQEEGITLQI